MERVVRALLLTLLASTAIPTVHAEHLCSVLGGPCSAEGTPCCDLGHDCVSGKCEVAGYVPSHGEVCNAECGLPCATRGETCVKGLCRGAEEDCAESGEDCNVEKGCCNPKHDCVPFSDAPLPPLWMRAGTCQVSTLADTGASCSKKTPCRFSFDLCIDGVCRVDPTTLLDVSAKTTVRTRASAFDTTTSAYGGCGKSLGCGALRTRDRKVKAESRWSCSESLGRGKCSLMFVFGSPQDVVAVNVAMHQGDARKQSMKVYGDDAYLGKYRSTGDTLEFETWTINARDITTLTLEATDLPPTSWTHVTEVEILVRNQVGCEKR